MRALLLRSNRRVPLLANSSVFRGTRGLCSFDDDEDGVLFSRTFRPEDVHNLPGAADSTRANSRGLTQVIVRLPRLTKPLHFQSAWSDEIELSVLGEDASMRSSDSAVDGDALWQVAGIQIELQEGGIIALTPSASEDFDYNSIDGIECVLPEQCDLVIETAGGGVTVEGKIEGDVRIVVGDGDIDLGKVRGEQLFLDAKGGAIRAGTIEGDQVVQSYTRQHNPCDYGTCDLFLLA